MKRLSKNLLSIFLSDIGRRLLGFLSVAYLARTVGTEGFGIISIGLTVLSYALMVSSSGVNSFGIREVARGAGANFVAKMISVRIVNAVLTLIIVGFISLVGIQDQRLSLIVFVTTCAVLPSAFHLDWYFQGKEEMRVVGLARLGSAAVYFFMLLAFVHSPENLLWVAVASVVGDVITAAVLLRTYRREGGTVHYLFSVYEWKSMMLKAFPLGAGSLLAHFSINLPPLVIGLLMTHSDVGIYSAGNKLVFFFLMLDRALATMLLPASSRLQMIGTDRLASVLEIALKWILITTLPIAVGGTLLARDMTIAVFGSSFQETIVVFQILIWYVVLTMIHTVFTSGMIAVGGEKQYGKIMGISAVMYAVTIVVGTMTYGVAAAAAAIVLSELLTVLMMRYQLHKHVTVRFPTRTVSILLSSALMGTVVWLMPALHLVVLVGIGCLSYAAFIFMTQAVTKNDLDNIVQHL